jgi:hypothetical protein
VDWYRFEVFPDSDRHQNGQTDLDRHQNDADSQHWLSPFFVSMSYFIFISPYFVFVLNLKLSALLCFPTFRYSPMPDFSGGGGAGKTGGKAAAGGRILPFHDEVEDSDEERGFMKPYSDNPRASNYTDDDK